MGTPEEDSNARRASPDKRTVRAASERQSTAPGSGPRGETPDRRRVKRKIARTFALIQDVASGNQIGIAAVIDLSSRGAGIRMTEPLAHGAFVRLTVEKTLSVARVKHCLKERDDYFRIGLEFTAA